MKKLIHDYQKYIRLYKYGMQMVDITTLFDVINLLKTNPGRIFVAGNGGSAAISNHLCCDFLKGADLRKVVSMSCNTPLITAISNDIGYEDSISFQVDKLMCVCFDTLILISSSGNSPNIIKAAKAAKKKNCKVIGLTGFNGGKLAKLADYSLHIPVNNYGIVEDCHQSLMHIISQYIAGEPNVSKRNSPKASRTNTRRNKNRLAHRKG